MKRGKKASEQQQQMQKALTIVKKRYGCQHPGKCSPEVTADKECCTPDEGGWGRGGGTVTLRHKHCHCWSTITRLQEEEGDIARDRVDVHVSACVCVRARVRDNPADGLRHLDRPFTGTAGTKK